MIRLLIGLALIFAVGCSVSLETKYKCINGKVYVDNGGVWIEALMYKDNKCAPKEAERE